jgi:hypothetical protein
MNLDENENYSQDDQYFQDDETRYEGDENDSPIDHPITSNAEPDYGDDLINDGLDNDNKEFNDDDLDNEESGNDGLSDLNDGGKNESLDRQEGENTDLNQ